VRLLLDEHYSPEIARQLRARGHDVVAVGERSFLQGRADRVHFAAMAEERRTIVTEDVGDFRPLLAEAARSGEATYGLICVSPRRFPRRRSEIGRLVAALDALLRSHPEEDAAVAAGGEVWLVEPA
jgi:hypothetical protein